MAESPSEQLPLRGPAQSSDDHAALTARVERLEALVAELTAGSTKRAPVFTEAPPLAAIAPPAALAPARPAYSLSLESALGARVLNKVAVLLLLMSAAWFLKWAFDNRWIGPLGRVVTGLAAGAGVMWWSERFRRQHLDAFSYALKAVGSGVLYLSLWAAFQLYHLLPATAALLAMLLVTVVNGVLAITQDAELLAALGLLGGLLTPLLLSAGGDHELFLFSYLCGLAAAAVALLRFKPWDHLLLGVFPAVAAYFIAWYVLHFTAAAAPVTMVFALLLWLVFALLPFVVLEPTDLIVAVLLPLFAAAFGALSVYSVLADSGGRSWQPWCAVAFAAVYLGFARARRAGVAATTHLSLALVFLAIAVALKATGRAVSVGWLAEAVALLWLASRTSPEAAADAAREAQAFRRLSCGLLLLGTAGALLAPYLGGDPGAPFFNRSFALILGDVLALAAAMYFARGFPQRGFLRRESVAAASLVLLNLVLLVGMDREISRSFAQMQGPWDATATEKSHFVFSAWMMLQSALLIAGGFACRVPLARWLGLLLLTATVVKTFAYDLRNLSSGYRVVSYLGLGVLLMCVSFAYQKDWLGLRVVGDEDGQ